MHEPTLPEPQTLPYRLHTANVSVHSGALGTAPIQVVEYARQLFLEGDPHKHIPPRAFDRVFAVFDRDAHDSYHQALDRAEQLDGKLKNDARQAVPFKAVASVPNFELWLLLHYENIQAPIERDEALERLRQNFPEYQKGAANAFAVTRPQLETALERAPVHHLQSIHGRDFGLPFRQR